MPNRKLENSPILKSDSTSFKNVSDVSNDNGINQNSTELLNNSFDKETDVFDYQISADDENQYIYFRRGFSINDNISWENIRDNPFYSVSDHDLENFDGYLYWLNKEDENYIVLEDSYMSGKSNDTIHKIKTKDGYAGYIFPFDMNSITAKDYIGYNPDDPDAYDMSDATLFCFSPLAITDRYIVNDLNSHFTNLYTNDNGYEVLSNEEIKKGSKYEINLFKNNDLTNKVNSENMIQPCGTLEERLGEKMIYDHTSNDNSNIFFRIYILDKEDFNIKDYIYEFRVDSIPTRYFTIEKDIDKTFNSDDKNPENNYLKVNFDAKSFKQLTGVDNFSYFILTIKSKYDNLNTKVYRYARFNDVIEPFISYDPMTDTASDITFNCRYDISVEAENRTRNVTVNINNPNLLKYITDNKRIPIVDNAIEFYMSDTTLNLKSLTDTIVRFRVREDSDNAYLVSVNDINFKNKRYTCSSANYESILKKNVGKQESVLTQTYYIDKNTNLKKVVTDEDKYESEGITFKLSSIKDISYKYTDQFSISFLKLNDNGKNKIFETDVYGKKVINEYNTFIENDINFDTDIENVITVNFKVTINGLTKYELEEDEKKILENIFSFQTDIISTEYGKTSQILINANNNITYNEEGDNPSELIDYINNGGRDLIYINEHFDKYDLYVYAIKIDHMVLDNGDIGSVVLNKLVDYVTDQSGINEYKDLVCNEEKSTDGILDGFNANSFIQEVDLDGVKENRSILVVPETVFSLFKFANKDGGLWNVDKITDKIKKLTDLTTDDSYTDDEQLEIDTDSFIDYITNHQEANSSQYIIYPYADLTFMAEDQTEVKSYDTANLYIDYIPIIHRIVKKDDEGYWGIYCGSKVNNMKMEKIMKLVTKPSSEDDVTEVSDIIDNTTTQVIAGDVSNTNLVTYPSKIIFKIAMETNEGLPTKIDKVYYSGRITNNSDHPILVKDISRFSVLDDDDSEVNKIFVAANPVINKETGKPEDKGIDLKDSSFMKYTLEGYSTNSKFSELEKINIYDYNDHNHPTTIEIDGNDSKLYILQPNASVKITMYNSDNLGNIPNKFGSTLNRITDTLKFKVFNLIENEGNDKNTVKYTFDDTANADGTEIYIKVFTYPLISSVNFDTKFIRYGHTIYNTTAGNIKSRDLVIRLINNDGILAKVKDQSFYQQYANDIIDFYLKALSKNSNNSIAYSEVHNEFMTYNGDKNYFLVEHLSVLDFNDLYFLESGKDYSYTEILEKIFDTPQYYTEEHIKNIKLCSDIQIILRTTFENGDTRYNMLILDNKIELFYNFYNSKFRPKLNRLTGSLYHKLTINNKYDEFFDYKIIVDDKEFNEGDIIYNTNANENALHKFRLYFKPKFEYDKVGNYLEDEIGESNGYMFGDVNKDGKIDIHDYDIIQGYIKYPDDIEKIRDNIVRVKYDDSTIVNPEPDSFSSVDIDISLADINNDGIIDEKDLNMIKKYTIAEIRSIQNDPSEKIAGKVKNPLGIGYRFAYKESDLPEEEDIIRYIGNFNYCPFYITEYNSGEITKNTELYTKFMYTLKNMVSIMSGTTDNPNYEITKTQLKKLIEFDIIDTRINSLLNFDNTTLNQYYDNLNLIEKANVKKVNNDHYELVGSDINKDLWVIEKGRFDPEMRTNELDAVLKVNLYDYGESPTEYKKINLEMSSNDLFVFDLMKQVDNIINECNITNIEDKIKIYQYYRVYYPTLIFMSAINLINFNEGNTIQYNDIKYRVFDINNSKYNSTSLNLNNFSDLLALKQYIYEIECYNKCRELLNDSFDPFDINNKIYPSKLALQLCGFSKEESEIDLNKDPQDYLDIMKKFLLFESLFIINNGYCPGSLPPYDIYNLTEDDKTSIKLINASDSTAILITAAWLGNAEENRSISGFINTHPNNKYFPEAWAKDSYNIHYNPTYDMLESSENQNVNYLIGLFNSDNLKSIVYHNPDSLYSYDYIYSTLKNIIEGRDSIKENVFNINTKETVWDGRRLYQMNWDGIINAKDATTILTYATAFGIDTFFDYNGKNYLAGSHQLEVPINREDAASEIPKEKEITYDYTPVTVSSSFKVSRDGWILADKFEGCIDGTKPVVPKLIYNEKIEEENNFKKLHKYTTMTREAFKDLFKHVEYDENDNPITSISLVNEKEFYKNTRLIANTNTHINYSLPGVAKICELLFPVLSINSHDNTQDFIIDATNVMKGSFKIINKTNENINVEINRIFDKFKSNNTNIINIFARQEAEVPYEITTNILDNNITKVDKYWPIYTIEPNSTGTFYIKFTDEIIDILDLESSNPYTFMDYLNIRVQNNKDKTYIDENIKWDEFTVAVRYNRNFLLNKEIIKNLMPYHFYKYIKDNDETKITRAEYYELDNSDILNIIDLENFNAMDLYVTCIYLDGDLIYQSDLDNPYIYTDKILNRKLYIGDHTLLITTSKYNGLINYETYFITLTDRNVYRDSEDDSINYFKDSSEFYDKVIKDNLDRKSIIPRNPKNENYDDSDFENELFTDVNGNISIVTRDYSNKEEHYYLYKFTDIINHYFTLSKYIIDSKYRIYQKNYQDVMAKYDEVKVLINDLIKKVEKKINIPDGDIYRAITSISYNFSGFDTIIDEINTILDEKEKARKKAEEDPTSKIIDESKKYTKDDLFVSRLFYEDNMYSRYKEFNVFYDENNLKPEDIEYSSCTSTIEYTNKSKILTIDVLDPIDTDISKKYFENKSNDKDNYFANNGRKYGYYSDDNYIEITSGSNNEPGITAIFLVPMEPNMEIKENNIVNYTVLQNNNFAIGKYWDGPDYFIDDSSGSYRSIYPKRLRLYLDKIINDPAVNKNKNYKAYVSIRNGSSQKPYIFVINIYNLNNILQVNDDSDIKFANKEFVEKTFTNTTNFPLTININNMISDTYYINNYIDGKINNIRKFNKDIDEPNLPSSTIVIDPTAPSNQKDYDLMYNKYAKFLYYTLFEPANSTDDINREITDIEKFVKEYERQAEFQNVIVDNIMKYKFLFENGQPKYDFDINKAYNSYTKTYYQKDFQVFDNGVFLTLDDPLSNVGFSPNYDIYSQVEIEQLKRFTNAKNILDTNELYFDGHNADNYKDFELTETKKIFEYGYQQIQIDHKWIKGWEEYKKLNLIVTNKFFDVKYYKNNFYSNILKLINNPSINEDTEKDKSYWSSGYSYYTLKNNDDVTKTKDIITSVNNNQKLIFDLDKNNLNNFDTEVINSKALDTREVKIYDKESFTHYFEYVRGTYLPDYSVFRGTVYWDTIGEQNINLYRNENPVPNLDLLKDRSTSEKYVIKEWQVFDGDNKSDIFNWISDTDSFASGQYARFIRFAKSNSNNINNHILTAGRNIANSDQSGYNNRDCNIDITDFKKKDITPNLFNTFIYNIENNNLNDAIRNNNLNFIFNTQHFVKFMDKNDTEENEEGKLYKYQPGEITHFYGNGITIENGAIKSIKKSSEDYYDYYQSYLKFMKENGNIKQCGDEEIKYFTCDFTPIETRTFNDESVILGIKDFLKIAAENPEAGYSYDLTKDIVTIAGREISNDLLYYDLESKPRQLLRYKTNGDIETEPNILGTAFINKFTYIHFVDDPDDTRYFLYFPFGMFDGETENVFSVGSRLSILWPSISKYGSLHLPLITHFHPELNPNDPIKKLKIDDETSIKHNVINEEVDEFNIVEEPYCKSLFKYNIDSNNSYIYTQKNDNDEITEYIIVPPHGSFTLRFSGGTNYITNFNVEQIGFDNFNWDFYNDPDNLTEMLYSSDYMSNIKKIYSPRQKSYDNLSYGDFINTEINLNIKFIDDLPFNSGTSKLYKQNYTLSNLNDSVKKFDLIYSPYNIVYLSKFNSNNNITLDSEVNLPIIINDTNNDINGTFYANGFKNLEIVDRLAIKNYFPFRQNTIFSSMYDESTANIKLTTTVDGSLETTSIANGFTRLRFLTYDNNIQEFDFNGRTVNDGIINSPWLFNNIDIIDSSVSDSYKYVKVTVTARAIPQPGDNPDENAEWENSRGIKLTWKDYPLANNGFFSKVDIQLDSETDVDGYYTSGNSVVYKIHDNITDIAHSLTPASMLFRFDKTDGMYYKITEDFMAEHPIWEFDIKIDFKFSKSLNFGKEIGNNNDKEELPNYPLTYNDRYHLQKIDFNDKSKIIKLNDKNSFPMALKVLNTIPSSTEINEFIIPNKMYSWKNISTIYLTMTNDNILGNIQVDYKNNEYNAKLKYHMIKDIDLGNDVYIDGSLNILNNNEDLFSSQEYYRYNMSMNNNLESMLAYIEQINSSNKFYCISFDKSKFLDSKFLTNNINSYINHPYINIKYSESDLLNSYSNLRSTIFNALNSSNTSENGIYKVINDFINMYEDNLINRNLKYLNDVIIFINEIKSNMENIEFTIKKQNDILDNEKLTVAEYKEWINRQMYALSSYQYAIEELFADIYALSNKGLTVEYLDNENNPIKYDSKRFPDLRKCYPVLNTYYNHDITADITDKAYKPSDGTDPKIYIKNKQKLRFVKNLDDKNSVNIYYNDVFVNEEDHTTTNMKSFDDLHIWKVYGDSTFNDSNDRVFVKKMWINPESNANIENYKKNFIDTSKLFNYSASGSSVSSITYYKNN